MLSAAKSRFIGASPECRSYFVPNPEYRFLLLLMGAVQDVAADVP